MIEISPMQKIVTTLMATALVLSVATGCVTDQERLVSSLERLVDALEDELARYRNGEQITPGEEEALNDNLLGVAYALSPTGEALRLPTVGGDMRAHVEGWGYWAHPSDVDADNTDLQIGLFSTWINAEGIVDTGGVARGTWDTYVYGTPTGTNPGFTAAWVGKARAIDPVSFGLLQGSARLEFESSTSTVDVSLTDFLYGRHENDVFAASPNYQNVHWRDIPVTGGTFDHYLDPRNYMISGSFYGDGHQGVAGKFSAGFMSGIYGALRD